ncbi:fimbrial protein [Shewanella sp. DNRA4]|uniref:fimbrial protein n=1 Tax=Shewanella sp. DNRA4 TaxID=2723055 RepID=UPI00146F927F|nr:fimbrial protein [Shewanella sp. DNRA4]NMD51099.1 fimbrial protein [Shewanella sp. DNRA4]
MFTRLVLTLFLLNFTASAFALCARVPSAAGQSWPAGWEPFDPTTGVKNNWNGGINGGGLNMGRVNLASDLVQPIGSVIANGGPVPLTQYGEHVGFQPEQVLFVCSPNEEGLLYEGFVASNGAYQGGLVIEPNVPELTHTTFVKRVGWRALHVTTGKYFSRNWQLRPLTGLDRDIYGRILVKAKNFSDVQLEFIKIPSPTQTDSTGAYHAPNTTGFGYYDPFGWVSLISHNTEDVSASNKLLDCKDGQSISECHISSVRYEQIVGPLSNTNAHTGGNGGGFTSYKGCTIANVTPLVIFSPISVSELEGGGKRTGRIDIEYHCENGATFGAAALGANSIGFKVSDASKNIAYSLGLRTPTGAGVTKLLSENYGAPGVAKGVAIEMLKNDSIGVMNWLTSSSQKLGGNKDGWYSPNGFNMSPDPIRVYNTSYDVELSRFTPPSLPADPVTAGIVYATAEVLIVVQ